MRWFQPRNPLNGEPRAMTVLDDFVYVLSNTGLSRSHVNGGGWRDLSSTIGSDRLRCFLVQSSTIFIGSDEGYVYRSADFGATWTKLPTRLSGAVHSIRRWRQSIVIQSSTADLTIADTAMKAWSTVRSEPAQRAAAISNDSQSFFLTDDSTIYRLQPLDSTLQRVCALPNEVGSVNGLFVNADTILLSSDNGMWRSTTMGTVWSFIDELHVDSSAHAQLYELNGLICCVAGEGSEGHPAVVFRSNDKGLTWKWINRFRGNADVALAYKNEVVVVDKRRHVIDVKPIINDALDLCAIPVPGPVTILAPHPQACFVQCDREPLRELRGMDVWLPVTLPPVVVRDAVYLADRLVVCGEGPQISYSDDGGLSWFATIAIGLPDNAQWKSIKESGAALYMMSDDSLLYRSLDGGLNWTAPFGTRHLSCMALRDSICMAWCASAPPMLFRCTTTSVLVDSVAQFETAARSMTISEGGKVIISDTAGGLRRSADGGHSWQTLSSSSIVGSIRMFVVESSNILAITDSNGVFLSSDEAEHWSDENMGLNDSTISCAGVADKTLLLGTVKGGLYYASVGVLADVSNNNVSNSTVSSQTVQVWPQPCDDRLHFSGVQGITSIMILSSEGRVVRRFASQNIGDIDIQDLASGVYQLRLDVDGRITSTHFCVIH